MMRTLCALLVAVLVMAACASGGRYQEDDPVRGGRYQEDEPVRLCVSMGSPPVSVYRVDNKQRIGTLMRSGCIALPDHVVEVSAMLCVTTVAVPWCVGLPFTQWRGSPTWSVQLGAFTSGWPRDVYTLRPSALTQ